MTKALPWYYAVDGRPVMVTRNATGELDVLVADPEAGALRPDASYFARVLAGGDGVEELTEAEFEQLLKLELGERPDPLATPVRWARTGDLDTPYEAWVGAEHWQLRLAAAAPCREAPYALVIDGTLEGVLGGWPEVWERPPPGTWDGPSAWEAALHPDRLRAHEAWLARGRQGPGRLVVAGQNLRGATPALFPLSGARFIDCDLSECRFPLYRAEGLELIDCLLEQPDLVGATLDGARVEGCSLVGGDLAAAQLKGARVASTSLRGCNLDGSDWTGAVVVEVRFASCSLVDAALARARFIDCDLRGADLRGVTGGPVFGDTSHARFERCDLRGARLDGRRLNGTVLTGCKLYGASGRPALDGPCRIVAPDLSEEGDGSYLADPEEILDLWR